MQTVPVRAFPTQADTQLHSSRVREKGDESQDSPFSGKRTPFGERGALGIIRAGTAASARGPGRRVGNRIVARQLRLPLLSEPVHQTKWFRRRKFFTNGIHKRFVFNGHIGSDSLMNTKKIIDRSFVILAVALTAICLVGFIASVVMKSSGGAVWGFGDDDALWGHLLHCHRGWGT